MSRSPVANPTRCANSFQRYEQAVNLMARFNDAHGVARYIVTEMIANPEREDYWRGVARACHDLLWARWH